MPPALSWAGSHWQFLTSPGRSRGYAGATVLSPEGRDIPAAFVFRRSSYMTETEAITATRAYRPSLSGGAASKVEMTKCPRQFVSWPILHEGLETKLRWGIAYRTTDSAGIDEHPGWISTRMGRVLGGVAA